MLMSPNKGETAVHGCHFPGDMAVRMTELARPWVGVCVPLALSLSYLRYRTFRVVQLRKYSPNSRCRPSSCLLAVLAMFLATISPSSYS